MNQENELGHNSVGNWQEIENYPTEEYIKDISIELERLGDAINRLNISSETKLPSNKSLLWTLVKNIAGTKGYIETLIDLNKDSAKKVSDLVH